MKCSGCQNDQWLGQDRGVILYVISNLRSNLIFTQTPRSITTGFFDFNNFTVECEERCKIMIKMSGVSAMTLQVKQKDYWLEKLKRKSKPTAIGEYHLYGDLCADNIDDI